jgi:hypothetical protein
VDQVRMRVAPHSFAPARRRSWTTS